MYVLKHFDHEAKETMLEMVGDIREEFKNILDEVCGQTRQIIQYIAIERDTYTSASKKKFFFRKIVTNTMQKLRLKPCRRCGGDEGGGNNEMVGCHYERHGSDDGFAAEIGECPWWKGRPPP